ncbi:hypothetical protein [Tenacibaculum dicentrarchi]|uniref:hypothetical protein n=1 Tax=Tenacibaculum dicentrarchi TaxID=669041 RepID=UPI000C7E6731|nr:conserved hypothetical protein [Tenacibaculum dicentrarchi]
MKDANIASASKSKTYNKVQKEIKKWMRKNSFLITKNARWYVGITNDPSRRKREHKNKNNIQCLYWKTWNMKSVRLSLALETHFHNKSLLDKDLKGGYDRKTSKHIYVYKKFPTLINKLK